MSVLFAGGEDSEVAILAGFMTTETDQFRTTYARGAINPIAENGAIHNFTGELASYIAAQGTACDFWYGFQYYGASGATTLHSCVTFSNAGVAFLRVYNVLNTGVGNCNLQTSVDGTNWTDLPASLIQQPFTPTEWTFHIKRHASAGCFQWWIGGELWYEVTGNTTGYFTTCTRVSWGEAGTNLTASISEIVATSADDPRVGMNCATLYYTGDGNDTDWTGGYADVAELSEDSSTVQTTAAAGDESSYLHVNMPALTPGSVVRCVLVSGKWRTTPTAPQNLSGYLRMSGVNYDNADDDPIQAVPAIAGLLQFRWHLSPVTGLAFTEAEVNASEPGQLSVT